MAYGLRTYDSAGNVVVDITDRLTRFVGSYSISVGANTTIFVSVPGMTNDGTWAYIGDVDYMSITISTNGLSVQNVSTNTAYSTTLQVFRV